MIDNDITTSLAYVEMVNRYEERIGELIYENETLGKANEELLAKIKSLKAQLTEQTT